MKKLLSLFTALLFVGSMWGTEVTVSWSASTGALGSAISSEGGTANGTIATTSGTEISYNWNYTRTLVTLKSGKSDYVSMSGSYMQLGSSNAGESVEFRTSNIPGTIKSVKVLLGSKDSRHTGTITVGGTDYNAGDIPAWASSAGGDWEGTGTSSGEIVITIDCNEKKSPIYIASVEVTYEEASSDPTVSFDPTEVAFGNIVLNASTTEEFAVYGENLTGALTATSSNTSLFTVAVQEGDSLSPDANGDVLATLVVTPVTTAYGDFDGTITINGGGLDTDTAVVNVSMHVGGIVTVSPASPNLAFGTVIKDADAEDYARTITVSASNLTPNKQIRIISPSNFQSDPININADANGVIAAKEVKLIPQTNLAAGSYGNNDAKYIVACTSDAEFANIEIGAPTMTIVACTQLATPVVTVDTAAYDTAHLSWATIANADYYHVEIYKGETKIEEGNVNKPTTAYTVGTVLLGAAEYTYKVQAVSNTPTTYCESVVASANFTTDDYPAATLILSANGAVTTFAGEHKLKEVVNLPTTASNACFGKVFVGWSADADCATAPELAKGAEYTLNSTSQTLYAVYATETPGADTDHDVFAATMTSTVTDGYAISAQAESKTGYYQDGSGTTRYVQVMVEETATQIIASEPSAITVNATIGGGSAKDPLGNNVYAQFLDASGDVLGDPVVVTTKVEVTTGKEYEVNMPVANYANVRGVRISHVKESGYNVRYYAISLSYTTSTATTYSAYSTSGPSVPTAIDNTEVEGKAVKVLRDGQIFILRGDKTFNAQGQLVK